MSTPEDCPYDTAMIDRRKHTNYDHEVRISLLEQSMVNITDELHNINGSITKLVWIAVTGFGVAVMQFILKGGLA